MTVLIVENTPDKVRGLLKRWFVEPKPNVFVGTINKRTREKVLHYILKYAPSDLAILVIYDDSNSQGFSIRRFRDTSRIERIISGHYLIESPPELEQKQDSPEFDERHVFEVGKKEQEDNQITEDHGLSPDPADIAKVLDILNPCLVLYSPKK